MHAPPGLAFGGNGSTQVFFCRLGMKKQQLCKGTVVGMNAGGRGGASSTSPCLGNLIVSSFNFHLCNAALPRFVTTGRVEKNKRYFSPSYMIMMLLDCYSTRKDQPYFLAGVKVFHSSPEISPYSFISSFIITILRIIGRFNLVKKRSL